MTVCLKERQMLQTSSRLKNKVGFDYWPIIKECSNPELTPQQIEDIIENAETWVRFILETGQPGIRMIATDQSFVDFKLDFAVDLSI